MPTVEREVRTPRMADQVDRAGTDGAHDHGEVDDEVGPLVGIGSVAVAVAAGRERDEVDRTEVRHQTVPAPAVIEVAVGRDRCPPASGAPADDLEGATPRSHATDLDRLCELVLVQNLLLPTDRSYNR